MKGIFSRILFVSMVFGFSIVVMAQDFPALRNRAEDVIKSRRPDWKLVGKEEKTKQVIYQYGTIDDGVNISIFYGSSQEEAAEKMKATLKFLSVGPGKKIATLGDEAHLWQSARDGFAGIRFRKSNVYIDLVAPSVDLAEDLARSLVQFIQKK